ncbi:MAG: cytochrome c oxidase subunit II [Acidobacteria bacterium]|nr:MAG: cytochrome c oxidase subunit II [Acidobacteriota bacterium]
MRFVTTKHLKPLALASASFLFSSCGGNQSAVDAAGIQAERLQNLWWLFFGVCTAVYIIVMTVLVIAFFRNRRAGADTLPEIGHEPPGENRAAYTVKGAVAVTVVILFVLMFVSFRTGSAINTLSQSEDQLSIKVTGNQWWWNVEYKDADPSKNVTTANELHLPLGRTVKVELQSNDVIHSIWLPNMHGKKDLIPNYPTVFYFRPDKIGTYWGQCAEFCGYEHAKMRFIVIVETPEEFDAWLKAGQQPSVTPTDPTQQHGQQIFLTSVCTQCHTVQGTNASGRVGPNLTHVASRQYIAAGSLQNTREHLRSWITDPQAIKPGNRMPMNTYSEEDLDALVSYIESLK